MPSTQDWIDLPLDVVEGMFAASQNSPNSGWEAKAVEFFKERLKEKDAQTWVPSLNDIPLHYLKPNSLVKFRCLIQDMFDPEFYMGTYETVDPSSKAKVLRCGRYKDVTECGVDFNSRSTVTAERQTFYCVPIPGENPWVKESYAGSSQARVVPSTSYVPSRQKRSYEEDEEDVDDMDTQPQKQREPPTGPHCPTDLHGNGDCKRLEREAPSSQTASSSHLDLNFPLPGEKGPSCLVKVYEDWDSFKLNDILEVYGILSVSPALSALADGKETSSSLLDPADCMETAEEQRVHSPPASLVPRLHMVYAKPLQHNNPLLPSLTLEDNSAFLSSTLSEMAAVRAELLTYLTHVLLRDALAAEYLILHLISNVYTRRDILPLGKFTLNLSGCPTVASYTERLYQFIQKLVPSSYYLGMSLQNMNQMQLVPKKDYVANRLVSGAAQLARNTSLFLDETKLEQGQLDTTGVRNVTALGNLISWQKVDYDFNYHQMEFPCNINVLIVSEARSLLPVRTQKNHRMKNSTTHSSALKNKTKTPDYPVLFCMTGVWGGEGLGFLQPLMGHSRVNRWRLSPASVTLSSQLPLASHRYPSSRRLYPGSHSVVNSPRNSLCAILVCWASGLPWRQLGAAAATLGEASGPAIYLAQQ